MGGLGAIWAAGAAYPAWRYLSPRPEPDPFGKEGRAKVEGVTPADVVRPGAGKNGSYAGRGLVVFRAASGELRAFDAKCTHAGCNVTFEGPRIFCHCHGGTYDLEGRNIAGPPPRPLKRLLIAESDGVLYVLREPKAGDAGAKGAGKG
jgi:Rieske Fe-S protein